MRITQWGEYGIHCACYIAQREYTSDPLVTAQEIADSQNIPVDYARQILQRLKIGDIVRTVRGPQGGYLLARKPEEINLAQILKAAEGDTFEVICDHKPLNDERCAKDAVCNLRTIWHHLHDHIESFLGAHTLSSLAGVSKDGEASSPQRERPVQIGR